MQNGCRKSLKNEFIAKAVNNIKSATEELRDSTETAKLDREFGDNNG